MTTRIESAIGQFNTMSFAPELERMPTAEEVERAFDLLDGNDDHDLSIAILDAARIVNTNQDIEFA